MVDTVSASRLVSTELDQLHSASRSALFDERCVEMFLEELLAISLSGTGREVNERSEQASNVTPELVDPV